MHHFKKVFSPFVAFSPIAFMLFISHLLFLTIVGTSDTYQYLAALGCGILSIPLLQQFDKPDELV
jgi:hypothetical protein